MGRKKAVVWEDQSLLLLDQRKLPGEVVQVRCTTPEDVARCIKEMVVRGAPAIGIAAAYGLVLAAREGVQRVKDAALLLRQTRPTAVNLFWAIDRMLAATAGCQGEDLYQHLLAEAHGLAQADIQTNQRIGAHGATLVPKGAGILTHCNAGALATVDYGTALGVVRAAHSAGKDITVYACETRPFLQGARLTTWELVEDGIPVTLITDNMAGYLMQKGQVSLVIVGADRIAANGDVANKIGTYGLAVLAQAHGIPFYVAAPTSTIDLTLAGGEEIPIEERPAEEVTHFLGQKVAPRGVAVWNPAFDVTPHHLITGIITEVGVLREPYHKSIKELFAHDRA
ncbi:MAG TPA: S-methyl-5-thioribose-1-phosphate isomerase [Firmicutes bacterium]|nr:S-methyl-5-thioribose-1-phosphate isomerase [Bacillota bacterium]